jgi:hypothetical protein
LLDLLVRAGIGGREARTLLSEVDRAVKAIVVSGTRARQHAGADDKAVRAFIGKPYLEELDATLNSVICCGKRKSTDVMTQPWKASESCL